MNIAWVHVISNELSEIWGVFGTSPLFHMVVGHHGVGSYNKDVIPELFLLPVLKYLAKNES